MITSKIIFITGGTGKLGEKFVKHFCKKKINVIYTSTTKQKINKLSQELTAKGYIAHGINIDLKQENAIDIIIDFLNFNCLWPEVLVNNARDVNHLALDSNGMPKRKGWLEEYLLDVVVPYELSMRLADHIKTRLKNVINISSMYGIVPANPNLYVNPKSESPINYNVAKAALIHLTKELSIRLANKNIRVNAISYGGIEGRTDESFQKRYGRMCPLGRMLHEDEAIGAIDFLVSNLSTGMTGHNLVVDGGWTVW